MTAKVKSAPSPAGIRSEVTVCEHSAGLGVRAVQPNGQVRSRSHAFIGHPQVDFDQPFAGLGIAQVPHILHGRGQLHVLHVHRCMDQIVLGHRLNRLRVCATNST